MKPLLIIDFSNIVHICWWPAIQAQENGDYDPRQVVLTNIEAKMQRMNQELFRFGIQDPEIVFVEDRQPLRKLAIFPEYRQDRKHEMPADIKPLVKLYLRINGYMTWCWSEDNEADDTIATLAKSQPTDRIVVIATTDKDLWQLIGESCRIYNTTKARFVSSDDISEKFNGITSPTLIPLAKALWGDVSDGIPNAAPRMQKQLVPLINNSDSTLDNLLSMCKGAVNERCQQVLEAGMEQIRINWEIVRLDLTCDLIQQTNPIEASELETFSKYMESS